MDDSWKKFFEGFDFARTHLSTQTIHEELVDQEFKVSNLIHQYRLRGHLFTKTNPVRERRKYFPTLDLQNHGLSEKNLDTIFQAGKQIGIGPASLRNIEEHLQQTYCESVGAEFKFIRNQVILDWLQQRMESTRNRVNLSDEEKKHIYHHLNIAVGFEKFIHKKFVGQKRFSLEGADALIPALDSIIETGAQLGVREFVIGMAHRGRLNVLANILDKPYCDIFKEFQASEYDEGVSLGDVKYHLGYDQLIETDSGTKVRIDLLPNPSHLETVGPLVEGVARARIDNFCQGDFSSLTPIIIHGDAAIAAQGVVYEVVQMSQLPGYRTGGTIHIVINNQVGFTTNYLDGRSSTYCTDIAKVTKAPVFHVNADDVEALIYTVRLAMEFRQEFKQDVFIDLLGYRKYGHNEGDEPRFTQPLLYKAIEKHPDIRELYGKKLIGEQIYTREEVDNLIQTFDRQLEQEYASCEITSKVRIKSFFSEEWAPFSHPKPGEINAPIETGLSQKELKRLFSIINRLPSDRKFFKKVHKILESREEAVKANRLDWAIGESLAYASLLEQGVNIRISGQDSERGTFAHRHAALVQEDTGEKYYPLKEISNHQAQFEVYNSHLSEYGVLGFEYGYASVSPNTLTIWEAQFGDFTNTAQVIIDQYISSAEEKWGLKNGLVLFLPHGYEGQGPEHSSARIERFLILCANHNMQVVYPTTPANLFHLLRRQMLRDFRIPLITFTPKSLLRHPECVSTLEEVAEGRFQPVIDDANTDPELVNRIVFCWGKIYYDLLKPKKEWDARDIALIRIEQMYPFPYDEIQLLLTKYKHAQFHIWVQEEPENMGAWRFIQQALKEIPLIPVCRQASGSPAVGLHKIHQIEQQELVDKVFRSCTCELHNKYCGLQCVAGKPRIEILKQFEYL